MRKKNIKNNYYNIFKFNKLFKVIDFFLKKVERL